MPVRARPSQGRSLLLALALLVAAASPVLGAGGDAAPDIPEPREQVPGEPSGFRLPFPDGLEVQVVQGWHSTYSHNGASRYAYDFGLYSGTPVVAAAPGIVSFTRSGDRACGGKEFRARGNSVTIDHADGSATVYGHLSTVSVEVGDVVAAGQVIARSGESGFTGCQPHLHFARQLQGERATRSIPVYFQGYEAAEFRSGDVVKAAAPCSVALAKATADNVATDGFCGAYYGGEFEGPELLSRAEATVDVDLAAGGFGGYWLDEPGPYSARWTGRFDFAPWWYTFRIDATGGVRLKVDGVVVYEDWVDQEVRGQVEVRQRMWPGVHTVEVEHFTTHPTDRVSLDWSPLLVDD